MIVTKFIFYTVLGWKISGSFDKTIDKSIIIGGPHTSWHDFYISVLARRLLKKEIHFIAKKELFKWPFGLYFKWMGGTPLDRTPGQNKVEAIAEIFQKKNVFHLALSPEGTRNKVEKWKTGFYFIAKTANVPIVPVVFNYGTKTFEVKPPFFLTDNFENDLKILKQNYRNVYGKVRSNS